MSQLPDPLTEELAKKLAHMAHNNWVYIDTMIKVNLHISLPKNQAIEVAKRALELMEEKHL